MKSYGENESELEISGVVLCREYICCRIGIGGQSPTILKQL
jgi:hypothetical protein